MNIKKILEAGKEVKPNLNEPLIYWIDRKFDAMLSACEEEEESLTREVWEKWKDSHYFTEYLAKGSADYEMWQAIKKEAERNNW